MKNNDKNCDKKKIEKYKKMKNNDENKKWNIMMKMKNNDENNQNEK